MLRLAGLFRSFSFRVGSLGLTRALCLGAVLLSLSSCKEEKPLYGSVRVVLTTGKDVDPDDLFERTKTIIIRAPYNRCAAKYYRGEGADLQFETPEGDEVAKEWAKRICAESDSSDTGKAANNFIECDPDNISLSQELDEKTEVPYMELKIVLESRDDARELAAKSIRVGPLPTEALTGCETAFRFNNNSIRGQDKRKAVIWEVLSEEVGTENPSVDSVRAYTVRVGRPDGK